MTSGAPSFIVIGGMKCGTTTLVRDLSRHSDIYFPAKELSFFNNPASVRPEEQRRYASLFDKPTKGGDCSTAYSMLPTFPGTATRVRDFLGPDVRTIYLVRNPILRSLSHHHHLLARGALASSFADALRDDPTIRAYSQYDVQLEPWLDAFGPERVLVVPLEAYVSRWAEVISRIALHVGVGTDGFGSRGASHENATESARVFVGRSRRIYESRIGQMAYAGGLRRVVPARVRGTFRRVLLPEPPRRGPAPPRAVLEDLAAGLGDLASLPVLGDERAGWDFKRTIDDITGSADKG